LVLIALAAIAGYVFLRDRLSFEALAQAHDGLRAQVEMAPVAAVAVFIAAYTVIVALSLPGATVATLTGGLLFGTFPGVVYNVIAATAGACLIFGAARAGLGRDLAARIAAGGGPVARLQAGLTRNVWSVLLVMRLVPAVPFVAANLIPALVGVRFLPFAVTTLVGIIPGTLVFTSVGAGLGTVLAAGGRPDLGIIFEPRVLLPLLGLALLALLPVVVQKFRRGA
jgi:uncharacterized membrane protein YdjX (TVP38/TMEM64 family)